jgi:hypothetical protein
LDLKHHLHTLKVSSELHFEQYLRWDEKVRREWQMHEELYSRQAHAELMANGEVLRNSINHAEAAKAGCILATAAWVEALANLVFTLRLKKDEFEAIDRLNIIDKWTVMMPFVVPAFSLPKEGQLFQALRELIYDRNALTHAKPMATEGDTVVHKGQSPKYSIGKHDAVIRKKLRK